jgi:hypothetical protein
MTRGINFIAGGWAIGDSVYSLFYGLPVHPLVIWVIGLALMWNAMVGRPRRTDLF